MCGTRPHDEDATQRRWLRSPAERITAAASLKPVEQLDPIAVVADRRFPIADARVDTPGTQRKSSSRG